MTRNSSVQGSSKLNCFLVIDGFIVVSDRNLSPLGFHWWNVKWLQGLVEVKVKL